MDFHKYGYTPKGASVVLYRDDALRRAQHFACAGWPGYAVVNATLQSTKSGAPLAAAWAVLHALGDSGYLELARRTLAATRRLREGIAGVPGLRLLGRPEMSLLAFASDGASVFHVADEMSARGFYVQPQLPALGFPPSLHLTVTAGSLASSEAFLADLRASTAAAEGLGGLPEPVRRLLAGFGPEGPPAEALPALLDAVGLGGGELPPRMAPVHEILAALPKAAVERLLVRFVSGLFRPEG
jgi:glutamate/tyrosine decarboxylase-like PLP-dependent enzyme